MQQELKKCADIMADADDKMQNLANVSGIVQPIEIKESDVNHSFLLVNQKFIFI